MAFLASAAYLTHQQKVLRLYKRALRHLESWCIHRWERGAPARGEVTVGAPTEAERPRCTGRLKDFWDRVGRGPLAPRSPPVVPGSNPGFVSCSCETLGSCLSGRGLSVRKNGRRT